MNISRNAVEETLRPVYGNKTDFVASVLLNSPFHPEEVKLYESASTLEEFENKLLYNKSGKMNLPTETSNKQLYGLVSYYGTDSDSHWRRCREIMSYADYFTKLDSDAGGVLLGNENFRVCVPNGRGDDTVRFAVFHTPMFAGLLEEMFYRSNFSLHGKFGVYSYDCYMEGDTPIAEFEGNYWVFYYDGLVVLEQFD